MLEWKRKKARKKKTDSLAGRRSVWFVIPGPLAIPLAYWSDNGKVHVSLQEQEIIAAHYLAIPKAQSLRKQPDSRRLHQTRESPMRVWLRTKYPSFNLLFFSPPLFFPIHTPITQREPLLAGRSPPFLPLPSRKEIERKAHGGCCWMRGLVSDWALSH